MEVVMKKFKELRIQDLVTFLICALSIYLLRARETHYITPAWWKNTDESHWSSDAEFLPTTPTLQPRPLVTDVDGDGNMEVIVVTNTLKLEILSPSVSSSSAQLPRLNPLYSVSVERNKNDHGVTGFPIAIESGYLDSINKDHKYRKQVIVVVFDDWTVLCYNHNLQLLWQQRLMDVGHIRENYNMKSMAILISSHSLERNDHGVVIVGGSYGHKSHNVRGAELNQAETAEHQYVADPEEDRYTHFSTFALTGANGTVRWHHLPSDFHKKQNQTEKKVHHWKLSLRRSEYHTGEVHWSNYGENILKHMPHQWDNLRDTRFDLGHIKKLEMQSGESESSGTILTDLIDFDSDHVLGMAYGGLPPHSRHEHVHRPNAVVVHNHEGVEVLSLETGRPLTRIRLSDPKTTFADINEDGTLEQVKVNFADELCDAEVSTIHPRPRALFKGPLCEAPQYWGAVSLTSLFQSLLEADENTHLIVPPVVVKSVSHRTGFVNHIMGHSLLSSRHGYDQLYLTSTGKLTSYGPRGEFNWQTVVPIQWSEVTRHIRYAAEDKQYIYNNVFTPSMVPMSAQIYGKLNVMLVLGWDSVAMVDLKDGYVMAEHSLPCQPADIPISEDFNDDGWTDFIVTCPNGYLGFTITKQPSYLYMTLISLTIVLTFLLLSWCCKPEPLEDTDY